MSISSYLVLRCRGVAQPARSSLKESLWSRWYVPWLAAALALVSMIVAAIAALGILTAAPRRPTTPPRQLQHVQEVRSDADLISLDR